MVIATKQKEYFTSLFDELERLDFKCIEGGRLDEEWQNPNYIFAVYSGGGIVVMITGGRFDFCLKKNFDRWANSREFFFSAAPQIRDLETLLWEAIRICNKYQEENKGWGHEQDITRFFGHKIKVRHHRFKLS